MYELILASKSPIRKKMLERANIPFEVIVSDADETPDLSKSFGEQLKEISMRKAQVVFERTINRGKRVIVAADQNIVFRNTMYGKPKTLEEAKELIQSMSGNNDIYAYVGNAIIYADGDKILQVINNYDISRMRMDSILEEQLNDYVMNKKPLTKCGGISIDDAEFLHLEEGKMSTACGMTIEYLQDLISTFTK